MKGRDSSVMGNWRTGECTSEPSHMVAELTQADGVESTCRCKGWDHRATEIRKMEDKVQMGEWMDTVQEDLVSCRACSELGTGNT